jgi:hypothetical protein
VYKKSSLFGSRKPDWLGFLSLPFAVQLFRMGKP